MIEAVPERVELKREIYERLSEVVSERCVLATNTSSMLVTAIAAAASNPGRVVGMHFFNPAPVMALLEVVAGERSEDWALDVAHATGEAMGKDVIRASDGPGFIVNRCNRPFGLEALRLLQERLADVETIDRIVRMEGGFRMGPFELMDLVGVDTGFEVSKSFYEQSFGEPRWRPSPITARYVAAGLHGRKIGPRLLRLLAGALAPDRGPRPPPSGERGEGVVVDRGRRRARRRSSRAAASEAGFEVRAAARASRRRAAGAGHRLRPRAEGARRRHEPPQAPAPARGGGAPAAVRAERRCRRSTRRGSAVGFHVLPPFGQARLVELTRSESSSPLAAARAERFFAALGKHVAWVGDAPGLVLGRIVCQIINESAFALGEGVGSAARHRPRHGARAQPPARAVRVGRRDRPRPRARGARRRSARSTARSATARRPALRRLVREGRLGRASGGGFFDAAGG